MRKYYVRVTPRSRPGFSEFNSFALGQFALHDPRLHEIQTCVFTDYMYLQVNRCGHPSTAIKGRSPDRWHLVGFEIVVRPAYELSCTKAILRRTQSHRQTDSSASHALLPGTTYHTPNTIFVHSCTLRGWNPPLRHTAPTTAYVASREVRLGSHESSHGTHPNYSYDEQAPTHLMGTCLFMPFSLALRGGVLFAAHLAIDMRGRGRESERSGGG
ncbi:hypothetical protein J3F83DRAFT_562917 [Trichoderma novae-zelandiae]